MPNSPWHDLAVFCNHLAPVVEPLAKALGSTALAIDSAERETKQLEARSTYLRNLDIPDVTDAEIVP